MRSTHSVIKKRGFSLEKDSSTLALLTAFCMFLSLIEYLIPKPVPFMRIGLANLPILISLVIFSPRGTLALVCLKIFSQGIVNGTLFSWIFLFSAAGSLASGLVMTAVKQLLKERVSMVGVSVAGALASNFMQILTARYLIFGEGAYLIGPLFLIIGSISSVLLGLFANRFILQSRWVQKHAFQN